MEPNTLHSENPLIYIGLWDLVAVAFGVLLRFLNSMYKKSEALSFKGERFRFSKYFDAKHVVRWALHLATSIAASLFLPNILVGYILPKYFEGLQSWTLFGSFIIGYTGYNLLKVLEKTITALLKKMGLNISLRND